jgi:formylglycine-generating enzyme
VDTERALLGAIRADPSDHAARLALADWLEEAGRAEQAELLRLHVRQMTREGSRQELLRLNALLAAGVRPVVPEVVNSLGMRFALIPAGTFLMGSPKGEKGRSPAEGPQHEVRITRPFYLGVFPVTQLEYRLAVGKSPSHFGRRRAEGKALETDAFPVESVSWHAAIELCRRLPRKRGERGRTYRLPSEAEWEYACRAGAAFYQTYHFGDSLTDQANFDGHYPTGATRRKMKGPYLRRTCPVGSYPPNAFGLYDLHGQVWEWCSDWFDTEYYARSPADDPPGPAQGTERTIRGGCWDGKAAVCRTAYRIGYASEYTHRYVGVRVVLDWPCDAGAAGGARS